MKYFIGILLLLISYVIGSLPIGYFIGKAKGINILEKGSKNIGATNVGRLLGFKFAFVVYLLDMLKGFLIVFVLRLDPINQYILLSPMLYGFLAVLGNAFSVFINFKGGKCVSISCGAISGYCPMLFPLIIVTFFIIRIFTKIISICSISTSIVTFISVVLVSVTTKQFMQIEKISSYNLYFVFFSLLVVALLIYKHKENIIRIIHKEEKSTHY